MEEKEVFRAPFTIEMITSLRARDMCYISGTIYTARDIAHLRLARILERGEETPSGLEGQVVCYASPCPAKPGQPIGSIGPTTGGRMDVYLPTPITHGSRVTAGKGLRNPEVVDAIKQCKGVYSAVIGGAVALMGECVKEAKVTAFDGPNLEAVHKLCVEELPVIVAVDSLEGDVHSLSRPQYARR